MSQPDCTDADEPSGPSGQDALRHCRGVSGPLRTATLRIGLAACLAALAVLAPGAARQGAMQHVRSALGSTRNNASAAKAPKCTSRSSLSNAAVPPPLSDVLYRRRELRFRAVELRLLRRRYARLKLSHRPRFRQRHRHPLEAFVPHQYWPVGLSVGSPADGADLSGLASGRIIPSMIEDAGGGSLGATTFSMMGDGGAAGTAASLLFGHETSALALSGGAAAENSKVTVNGDGGLELSFAPDWSLTAKLDGEVAPQPQLYAGSATLNHTW
jgi:hypothetical protein